MHSDDYLPLVRWGEYSSYEGPWTLGKHRYEMPKELTFWDKVLAVMVATEGGRYGAINCYDRCIVSVGLIQFCEAEAIYAVSQMLGYCAEVNHPLLMSYLAEMPSPCGFSKNERGRWRFFVGGREVATKAQQRDLFLGGSTGLKGQWSPKQKEYARRVTAVLSCLWQEGVFRKAQETFTHERLLCFATPQVKEILFPKSGYSTEGAAGALRAAFLSFAGNLPAVADKVFRRLYATPEYQRAGLNEQLILALKALTFEPDIAIYPIRYQAIRPVLEKQFGVELPDFAEELHEFKMSIPETEKFPDMISIQTELIRRGYDLGPKGADGVFGPKTQAAIKKFEQDCELPYPDGLPDAIFMRKLSEQVDLVPESVKLPTVPDDVPLRSEAERIELAPTVVEAQPVEGAVKKGSNVLAIIVAIGMFIAAILAAMQF